MQDTGLTGTQGSRVLFRIQATPGRLNPVHGHIAVANKGVEQADCVTAPANAGHQRVGKLFILLQHLLSCLTSYDGVEVTHHDRIGMGPGHGTDRSLYFAGIGGMQEALEQVPDAVHRVMLTGHNPTMSQWVHQLTGASVGSMPTAAIAVIAMPAQPWALAASMRGELLAYDTPKGAGSLALKAC